MRQVGAALRAENVAAVVLVHGSFDGVLTLRALAELARVFPAAGPAIRRVMQRFIERPTQDIAYYSDSYAWALETSLNPPGYAHIPVHLFHWSGENHHLGRADAAVRLIDELDAIGFSEGQRVLLWGHSHAGNVFALLTNLLAGHREAVERFFDAARIYYRWPLLGLTDIPVWERVRQRLAGDHRPLAGVSLDLATFGTPIRYGWDSAGYSRLLHFIHRRPAGGLPIYRALFPPELNDVMSAAHGDYVQQLGIAGTNTAPSLLAWRAWLADRHLGRLLRQEPETAEPVEQLPRRQNRPRRRHDAPGRLRRAGRKRSRTSGRPRGLHGKALDALPRRGDRALALYRPRVDGRLNLRRSPSRLR